MPDQTMTLKADGSPVVIVTPLGIIQIARVREEPRKVHLKLPPALMAFNRMDKALKNSPFLERDEKGNLKPKFDMLSPKFDDDGNLIGLQTPTTFVLKSDDKVGEETCTRG